MSTPGAGALGAPAGAPAFGAWSVLGSAAAAEVLARAGWDFLVLDAQHGLWDAPTLAGALAGALTVLPASPPVLVRLASDAAAEVGAALDAGAAGVVVPQVSSPAQAAAVAAACRYPPRGARSWGAVPALRGRRVPSAPEQDAAVTCAVMVETAQGLAQAGAIAAAPGVDAVLVGPFDLSLATGTTVEALLDDDAPSSPLARVVAACRAAGVVAAAYAGTVDRAERLVEHGFTAVAAVSDAGLLSTAAGAERRRLAAG